MYIYIYTYTYVAGVLFVAIRWLQKRAFVIEIIVDSGSDSQTQTQTHEEGVLIEIDSGSDSQTQT